GGGLIRDIELGGDLGERRLPRYSEVTALVGQLQRLALTGREAVSSRLGVVVIAVVEPIELEIEIVVETELPERGQRIAAGKAHAGVPAAGDVPHFEPCSPEIDPRVVGHDRRPSGQSSAIEPPIVRVA